MNSTLPVLKLTLAALGEDTSIATVDDRKRVQKAIYLVQADGLDLGYRYGWYIMGPYSTGLTQDYFKLNNELAVDPGAFDAQRLRPDLTEKLKRLSSLLQAPPAFGGTREDWLELLASVHFLRTVSKKSDQDTRSTLAKEKSHVSDYYELASEKLGDYQLLN